MAGLFGGRQFGARLYAGRLFGPEGASTPEPSPLADTGTGGGAGRRAQRIQALNNQLMVLVAAIVGSGCLDDE